MEEPRYHDEEAKECKLEEQADNNDLLSDVQQSKRTCCLDTTTSGLDKKADHIASHEHLCEPVSTDQSVFFTIDQQNYAAEHNVYGRSEESGGDQEEQRLHDERTQRPQVVCA